MFIIPINRIKNVTKITKILVSRFDKSISSRKMNKDSTAFIYANATGFSLSRIILVLIITKIRMFRYFKNVNINAQLSISIYLSIFK